ncbi:hypothetical protein NP493_1549g00009 [Ridgeia piscesae]|uniref:Vitellogenin domain-containing protein n=1 Tax=Ridgeia piscesae TaxID=27915 RepID=A0AAD9JZ85_RIDPI|nr:hypothetical protein NP493_1549g00009 [Ridgeia piscesae]
MTDTLIWRFCLYMFMSFSLIVVVRPQVQPVVWFQPDTEYTYKYEGYTHIKDVALIKVSAQSQLCRLQVRSFDVRVNQRGADENPASLSLKKNMLGTFSSKLVVSDSSKAALSRWAYRVNETGHEGIHSAVYHANPSDEEIVFTKIKLTKAIENADQDHTKVCGLHQRDTCGIKYVSEYGLPKMGGTSTSVLLFVRADPVVNTLNKSADDLQSNMEIGTLKVEPVTNVNSYCECKDRNTPHVTVQCILPIDIHTGLPCFRHIVTMLRLLSREDINKMTVTYLRKDRSEVARQTMIDALGGAHTSDCYSAMMQHVFHAKHPEAELLMRALFQLVDLSAPTPEVVFSTLEHVVFNRTCIFEDEEVTQQVNDRATLVLATVAKKVQHSRSEWASNPYHHRQLRSTMTEKEESNYLNWKTLHIHALGNAARDSSLGYLESYLNDSTINIALRSSAVDAIAKYKHKYVRNKMTDIYL